MVYASEILNVDETERAELITALHQAATFAEALLDLSTRLLDALTTGENRPDFWFPLVAL